MQTLLQLNPPIPMKTPRGEGMAVMVIDYGPDFDLWWTVILSKGEHAGEIWTYSNPEVRGVENITLGRHLAGKPEVARSLNGNGHETSPEPLLGVHPGEKMPMERMNGRPYPPPGAEFNGPTYLAGSLAKRILRDTFSDALRQRTG